MRAFRQAAKDGHNAKLKAFTSHYGAASKDNIPSESARLKMGGPEGDIGYGADVSKPRVRADRIARRPMASNPPKYAKGGAVQARASGGRTKKAGHTHVNVVVAPQAGGGGGGGPPVLPVPAMAPPMPGAGGAPPMPPRPPMGGMPPGAMGGMPGAMPPPGLPVRKSGGRIALKSGGGIGKGIKPGGMSDSGSHKDEKQDRAIIKAMVKNQALKRADGGSVNKFKMNKHFGGGSGLGRLEKIGETKKVMHKKPQAV